MINRDETYIIDIEKEQYLIAKKVKQFDTVFLKYKLYKDSKELNLTGVNLNIKIAKPDKTFIEQTNNYTVENNIISIDLNKLVTNVPGNCLIDIVIKKNNTQITTFTTTLDIKSSNYYKNVDPKNIVTVLEDLDSSIDLAQDRVNNLDIRNNTATTNINNLDARNNTATTKIRDLDSRNATATTNINNLDVKNNEAVTNKSSLYTENSVAQMHLEELQKKTEVALETKEEINGWINQNKDISKINERINNNVKEITNLKDSIAQNKPIVIAEDTPIGSVVWYASKEVLGVIDEDCWRVCNGQTLNKADFPDLYELIKDNPNYTKTETTFNLPDLISSKRFIRAVGDSYNVGYVENDELKSHRHFLVNSKGKFFEISGSTNIGAANNAVDTFFVSGATKPNKVGYTNEGEAWMYATCTNYVGGDETRPKNIQFIPLIKCKCRAKDIVDLATDVEQAKAGFNTLKEAMDSKATKESISEITEEISNAEEAILDINNELKEARNGEVSLDARIEKDINKINDNIDNLSFLPFEGENIDIDNSLNGYTRDLIITGKTLHNIRIGEDIQNPGYTVWTKVSNNEYNAVGTTEQKGNGGLILSARTLFKPSTKYSLILEYTASGVAGGEIRPDVHTNYNAATTTVHAIQNGSRVIKLDFTTRADITDKRCKIALSEFIGTMNMKNIMIIENIDYTPKYFEGIKSVGELEENKISILSHGKNLFNLNNVNYDNNITRIENGIRVSNRWAYNKGKFKINLKPNTAYYSHCKYNIVSPAVNPGDTNGGRIALFNRNKNAYYHILYSKYGEYDFTTPSDISDYNEIIFYADGSSSTNNGIIDLTDIIISERIGNYKIYEPYKEDKKDILLPFANGLKSLPNGVSDEIKYISTKYKINKKIKMRVLDGTEDWKKSSDSDRSNTLNFVTSTFDSEIKNGSPLICNKFINKMTWGTDEESCAIEAATLKLRFRILKSKLESEDIAGFKKYLRDLYNSGNPVVIYYELAEPVVYDLDKDLNLEVYKDKTYISSNNSIQPIISCKAPVDVQATISNLRENNKELEEENIKLKNNLSEYASKLEDSNLEMLKQNIDTDFRLMELEFALDL